MVSSSSIFSTAQQENEEELHSVFDHPTLKELATIQLIKELGSLQKVQELILQHPKIDLESLCKDSLKNFESQVKVLLQYTAKGNEIEAKKMSTENYALILSKSTFTEEWCGQRHWKIPISPLQYAAWAGDTEIVDIYLNNLPRDLKQDALEQLKEVRVKGTEHGKHLSAVAVLIKEYEKYYISHEFSSSKQRNYNWIHKIGLKQLHSVVNLLQWFASSIPFRPLPNFDRLPEKRSLTLLDGTILNLDANSSLGSLFSLFKGEGKLNTYDHARSLMYIDYDLAALNYFYKARIFDLDWQISQLQAEFCGQITLKVYNSKRISTY